MLKVFRDNLKNLAWILWVVIAVTVLAIAADFGASMRGRGDAGTVAKVGSETVTREEFKRAYQRMTDMYRQIYGGQLPQGLEKQLYQQTLSQTVVQKTLLLEARRLGLAVTDAELRDRILSIPGFKDEQGNFIGEAAYARAIQNAFQTSVADFEKELRNELLMKKLNDALQANLYVSEEDIQRAYRDQVERAKIRYIQVPRARFSLQTSATPDEVKAYYDSHKQEFSLPEQRDIAYLLVNGYQLADQVKVSDQDLRSYYDAHKSEYAQEEQVKARHILVMVNDQRNDAQAQARIAEVKKKLEGGADFAAMAREYSDDTASKDKGGDLGYFGRNKMVKEFEDAAFSAQPGKLVGPVKSSFGYHLIEVTDKRPAGEQPFDAVKEQIRARLTAERSRDLAESKAKDLASKLNAKKPSDANALKALAAQNPGVTFGEAKIGAADPVPGVGMGLSTPAFALKKGEVSQAVQIPQGWGIVYVKDVIPAHAPELKEVEQKVRTAVINQKLQQMTMKALEDAKRQLAQGKTLDQVAQELGVQAKETPEFGGQAAVPGIGYNPELTKAVMALQTGQVGGPIADAQGGLLFQVTDRKGWDPKQYAANREQTRSTLLQQKVGEVEGALIQQRERELKVSYDQQFLEQLGIAPPQQGV
ncbi:MAG TPA: peptidyl-prolyl cis-trans isomerase [Thermoanaerobaculia bacterium]